MQTEESQKLLRHLPLPIYRAIITISQMYDQLMCNSNCDQDELQHIQETAKSVEIDFVQHRKYLYEECSGVLYSLDRITDELKTAQEEKKLNDHGLRKIEGFIVNLSASLTKHQDKNKKTMKRLKNCENKCVSKKKSLEEKILGFDVQSLVDIAVIGTAAGYACWGSITYGMTATEIASVISATTCGGIVAAAIFASITLYFLFKHFRKLKLKEVSDELKTLTKNLSTLFTTASNLDKVFIATICDLEFYSKLNEELIQLSDNATPANVKNMTRHFIKKTDEIQKKFTEIKDLALK